MSWIPTKTAVRLSGLSRKRLIELADQNIIRSQRLGDKGWRRYWRGDIEILAAAPLTADAVDLAADPYHRLLQAVRKLEEASALVTDADMDTLEAIDPMLRAAWVAFRSLLDILRAST